MKTLSKQDIADINAFLIRHRVKFIDARVELINHVVLDYEAEHQDEKLHAFLMQKRDFIKQFVTNRQRAIHWSYQKKLCKQVAAFFYKPKLLVVTMCIVLVMFYLNNNLSKMVHLIFFGSIAIPQIITLYFQLRDMRQLKNIQSFQSVCSLMALPSLFLYLYSPLSFFLQTEASYFFIYWFIALLFNISGVLIFNKMIKKTKEKYNQITAAS